jgi:hypothetical protein
MDLLNVGLIAALGLALLVLAFVVKYARLEHKLRLKKATDAFRIGGSQKIGDISQVIGTFGLLTEYDELSLLSSTSAQSSMDLIGRKGNRLDIIELKTAGAPLTRKERALKKYIEAGDLHVAYRIIDVVWPDSITIRDRVGIQ